MDHLSFWDIIGLVSFAVGLMSLVLGGFAIWLSWVMYTKAKEGEQASAETLIKISVQTDILQKLNSRTIDRLTKYVTEPRPIDEKLGELVSNISKLPAELLAHLRGQSAALPAQTSGATDKTVEELVNENIALYIAVCFYSGLTNLSVQDRYPDKASFDVATEENENIKKVMDGSAEDFRHMKTLIEKIDVSRLDTNVLNHLWVNTKGWQEQVKTASEAKSAKLL